MTCFLGWMCAWSPCILIGMSHSLVSWFLGAEMRCFPCLSWILTPLSAKVTTHCASQSAGTERSEDFISGKTWACFASKGSSGMGRVPLAVDSMVVVFAHVTFMPGTVGS